MSVPVRSRRRFGILLVGAVAAVGSGTDAGETVETPSVAVPSMTDSVHTRRPVVAVMELRNRGVPATLAVEVRDSLISGLVKSGAFEVVAPSRMEGVHDPRDFVPLSKCSEAPCATRAGRMLDADQVVVGEVDGPEKKAVVLRVVDVVRGEVFHEFSWELQPQKSRWPAFLAQGVVVLPPPPNPIPDSTATSNPIVVPDSALDLDSAARRRISRLRIYRDVDVGLAAVAGGVGVLAVGTGLGVLMLESAFQCAATQAGNIETGIGHGIDTAVTATNGTCHEASISPLAGYFVVGGVFAAGAIALLVESAVLEGRIDEIRRKANQVPPTVTLLPAFDPRTRTAGLWAQVAF